MSSRSPSFTRDEQIKEIIKCGKDPVYFIKNYTKIQHPTRGTIAFDTYPFQDKCLKQFQEHRLNIVLKSRQLGLSTICAAYAVWMAVFQKDKNILVIATKLATAQNFIKKVAVILQNMPKWLLLPKFEPSKQQITFNNGSQIKAIPTSDDAGRSEALSLLIIDEAAFIRDFDEIWAGLSPTFSTGGRAIILSTPNGVGGQYYSLWTEAEAGVNGFNPIRIMWYEHPEHDQEWFEKETRNLPKKKISQEYMCVGEDTRIITPDGYKKVKDIKVGDRVLTHNGRFKPITKVASRLVEPSENLYQVSSPGNRRGKFLVTGNHPALSYRFWANNESSLDYLLCKPAEQHWIEFDEIFSKRKNTDKIVNVLFPRLKLPEQSLKRIDLSTLLQNSVNVTDTTCRYPNQWGSTTRFVDVDFNLGKLVGLYLAEGCNARGGFDMGFHKNELHTHVKWVVDYATSLGARVTVSESKDTNGCRLWTQNKHMGALVRLFVKGDVSYEKTLDMDLVMSAGKDFIRGLLYGHHAGDGNHTHTKKTSTYSTSPKLIYQLRTLNSVFGLYPRIGIAEISKKNPRYHDMWNLEFQAEKTTYHDLLVTERQQYKKQSRTRLVNDQFVGKHTIKKVAHGPDDKIVVYDISVEDDKSFVAESAVLHNCDFVASGDTFLQPTELEQIRVNIQQPMEKFGDKRDIWVWSYPIHGRQYVLSADIARGDARDFSAFHIIDTEDCEVAAEYMGKIAPEKFADLVFEWGKKYNDALAVPENNTFGYFVNTKLRDLGYKRIYYHSNRGDPFNYIPTNPEELPGFPTNQKTRVQILTKLEELIRNGQLKTYSQRLYDQLQAFVWNGNKPMASKDSYDDLIMSLAIGCWLIEGGATTNNSATAMAYAMLKATGIDRRDVSAITGDINSVKPVVNHQITGYTSQNVHKPRDASEVIRGKFDYRWLFK